MTESNKTTYEIVESPILGDPLAPLRMQDQDSTADWRDLLHYHIMKNVGAGEPSWRREFREESTFQYFTAGVFDVQPGDFINLAQELAAIHDHNEDRVHDLPNGLLEDMAREIKNIFGDAVTNITFRHFTFDKDGNMVEI